MAWFTFTMRSQRWQFQPNWFPTLVTFIILPILLGLGFWQLQRADYKQQLLTVYQARLNAGPMQLSQLPPDLEQVSYQQIQLTGHYDNQRSILLDNKIHEHQPGYQVLTPFIPEHSQTVVLINRGWIASGPNRQQRPKLEPVSQPLTLTGIIYLPRKQPLLLKPDQAANSWPLLSQRIDLNYFSQQLKHPLYPFIVLLDPKAPSGFVREWNPVSVSPYKNIGYAVQWFALAAALFIIFIVVNCHREKQ